MPIFGVDGTNKRESCFEHKKDGMLNVKTRRCGQQGCTKRPSFGMEGSNKGEFCSEHKKDGMVDVANKRCGQ